MIYLLSYLFLGLGVYAIAVSNKIIDLDDFDSSDAADCLTAAIIFMVFICLYPAFVFIFLVGKLILFIEKLLG